MTLKDQIKIADIEFRNYEFGEGVRIVEQAGWNTDDTMNLVKVVYAEYDGEEETQKISFHVAFDSRGEFIDVYALECKSGNEIGERGNFGMSA